MLDILSQAIAENGGPTQSIINAGAGHVQAVVDFECLGVVTEIDLAALMVGSLAELAGLGNNANQLLQASCKELVVTTPSQIVGGTDSRVIDGDDLCLLQDTFPFLEVTSLELMLGNHFSCIASMQNLLASYPKMNWLSLTSSNKKITAGVNFDLSPPAYVAPLSLTCSFEIETEIVALFDTQEVLSFEPWDKTALRLQLLEPEPTTETIH